MIGYKVVIRTDEGILRSANYGRSDNPEYRAFTVDYIPNELTLPKLANTKLLAFSTKEHAFAFQFHALHEVWKAQLISAVRIRYIVDAEDINIINAENIKAFWHNRNKNIRMLAPKGTVACVGVILLEKIFF
jgi:hypothetical protein